MRYTVNIATRIAGSYDNTDEDFSSYEDALQYLITKAKAWEQVAETMETLEWYKLSIESN